MFEWVCMFDDTNGEHSVKFFGVGLTPQGAWENMLEDNAITPEDVDMENLAFYGMDERVVKVTRIEWDIEEDSQDNSWD